MATKKTATVTTTEAVETVKEVVAEEATVKAKVLRTYRDKETLNLQKAGTIVELTAERFQELSAKGYVRKA
ncbi:MAG: hypothetical protein LUH45_06540 [Clostridiales bacterium]|nr:hypothetical protein [Clostridiales bacterium]